MPRNPIVYIARDADDEEPRREPEISYARMIIAFCSYMQGQNEKIVTTHGMTHEMITQSA